MSEPWIRVYPLEMRGDPKLAGVNAERQLALIHAWDIAKNGPGEVGELRAADGHAISERELRRMVGVDPNATRALFQRWAERDLCELQDEDGKVLVHFPDLARRQGIDPTNAERQRRFRERKRNAKSNGPRNAKVTVDRNDPVTGESKSREELYERPPASGLSEVSSSRKARRERPRDIVWDAFVEGCEYEPGTNVERGAWNKARKEAGNATREDVLDRCAEFKRRYPGLRCTPTAVVRQWGALGTTNGHKPKKTLADYERIIAEHEGRQPQPAEELDVPY